MVAWNSNSSIHLSIDRSNRSFIKISGKFVSIIAILSLKLSKVGNVLDELRNVFSPEVSIQIINANIVFGAEHLLRTLTVTFESKRRGTVFVRDEEIDLLLRLSYTRQVSDAIAFAGFTNSSIACLILYSGSKDSLIAAKKRIEGLYGRGDSTYLEPNKTKKITISARLGIDYMLFDDISFMKYLVERGALIVK